MIGDITQKHLNKLEYYNNIKTLSPNQQYEIDKKNYDKILEKKEKLMLESLERVKNEARTIFINYLQRFVKESELTTEIWDKEMEYCNY